MDLRELQYILKVAEERSFSRAASKLYIAQPSLSQYIAKVEQSLGVQLFERTTPLRLTYAGELYTATARSMLAMQQELQQQMEDIAEMKRGRLSIGTSAFRSTYILPSLLPPFKAKFPGIEVVLMEGSRSELEEWAVKGVIDLALFTLPVQEGIFDWQIISREEILLAVPPGHSLCCAGRQEKGYPAAVLADLQQEPFIALKPGGRLRHMLFELCRQVGFKPDIVLESKNIETAHALAAAGLGLTLVPDTLVQHSKRGIQPVYFSLADVKAQRTAVIAYPKGRYLSKAAAEFIELTQAVLGEKIDSPSKKNI